MNDYRPSATLFAQNGTTVLGSIGPENATTNLNNDSTVNGFNLAAAPLVYLKLSAMSQDGTNTGTDYRCFINFQ